MIKWLVPIVIGLVIWRLPVPHGVQQDGWTVLAVFVATVLGLILQPLPLGAVALIGLTVTMVTGTLAPKVALSGFSDATIWLIVAAFFIAKGFTVTGLGKRIALMFVRSLGRRSLGLAYGMALTDLVLAPATPSNTARAGGVIFPIIDSLSKVSGSEPFGATRRRLGAFLCVSAAQVNTVTSAMFLTAMAANPVVQKLAADQGVTITWGSWFVAALAPGLVSLALVPLLIYKIYPPELKDTPEAPGEARRQLDEMGALSSKEKIMAGAFVLLLFLWSAGSQLWDLSATTAAFVGICLLLVTGVLSWQQLLEEKAAWTTLVWFAVLVMMAGQLNELGVIGWFSKEIAALTGGLGWVAAFVILTLIYFFSHYAFASNTAHVAAMYSAFLAAAIAAGTPAALAALVLGFISSLWGGITHYAAGPVPVLFGSGYSTLSEWWRIGLGTAVMLIVIWMGIGSLWLKLLGYW